MLNYFAYGSNLCLPRLRSRVPGAALVSLAPLHGFALRWHKRSQDGSGKASVLRVPNAAAFVWGALFRIPADQRAGLDKAEGLGNGYRENLIEVEMPDGELAQAWTYVAMETHIEEDRVPFAWYRDLVVCGAQSLGLPASYVDGLKAVQVRVDQDKNRESRERGFLPCMT